MQIKQQSDLSTAIYSFALYTKVGYHQCKHSKLYPYSTIETQLVVRLPVSSSNTIKSYRKKIRAPQALAKLQVCPHSKKENYFKV